MRRQIEPHMDDNQLSRNNTDYFTSLYTKNLIVNFLDSESRLNVELVNKTLFGYFQPKREERILSKLLLAVAHGEYFQVEKLLKITPQYLLKRGNVTDYSGRTFIKITPFEYALWALDGSMWMLILNCVSQSKEGKCVIGELYAQYQGVKKKGVTYTLDDKTVTEVHFDFKNTIIKQLKIIDALYWELFGSSLSFNEESAISMTKEELDTQWIEGVGGAQKLLPVHAVCMYRSLSSSFTMTPEPPSLYFYTFSDGYCKPEFWFSPKLGIDFAIDITFIPQDSKESSWNSSRGLNEMKMLYKSRANELIWLGLQLEKMASENQPKNKIGRTFFCSKRHTMDEEVVRTRQCGIF